MSFLMQLQAVGMGLWCKYTLTRQRGYVFADTAVNHLWCSSAMTAIV
jgi:hypothetical protein